MARSHEVTLKELGEDKVVAKLLSSLPGGRNVVIGPGDDCAVVQTPGARELLLLKTDCVAEGIHYRPEDDPERVGWKALCRPLSDIAAMGGDPLHALIAVLSPEERRVTYWQAVYKGIAKAAARFNVGIVGGETSRAPFAAISVSLTGRVEPARLITRSGGQPNDRLFVTGTLGGSSQGRHLDFVPRIVESRWLSARGFARAMMDLSDGLAADLPRLAAACRCGFEIDPAAVPRNRGCDAAQAMTDGEDYELLMAVPPRLCERLVRGWKDEFPKLRLSEIGRLTEPGESSSALPRGFDHFFDCQPAPREAT